MRGPRGRTERVGRARWADAAALRRRRAGSHRAGRIHHPYGAGRRSGKTPGRAAASHVRAQGWCGAATGGRDASDDSCGRLRQAGDVPRFSAWAKPRRAMLRCVRPRIVRSAFAPSRNGRWPAAGCWLPCSHPVPHVMHAGHEPHQRTTGGDDDHETTTRKLCVLAIGTFAAMAMARYGADQVPSPPHAAGILQCRSVDANGLPTGCVPIDPSHFGFAAMRACETGAAARRSRFTRFDFNRTRDARVARAPVVRPPGNAARGNVRVSPSPHPSLSADFPKR